MKVLIVDDSLLDRKLLAKTLQKMGVKNEILQAEDGEAALNIIAQNIGDICVMFCDYHMPKMTGIELMTGLAQVPATATMPMVMITASATDESRKAAYTANPNLTGYLVKPYKPEDLLSVIKPYVQL